MTVRQHTRDRIQTSRLGLGRPRKWLAVRLGVSLKTLESRKHGTRIPREPARLFPSHLKSHRTPDAGTELRPKAGRIPLDTSLLVRHGKPSLR